MKDRILKIFFLDFVYFILLLFIVLFSRLQIQSLLSKIQSYAPELNTLNNQNILDAQGLISQINSLSVQAYLFIFIVIPLIIFILYILLQGYGFYLLKKEKKFLLKFSIINLPVFIFISLLIFIPNVYLFILVMLISYLTFFLHFHDKKRIPLTLTKFYKYFPAYLLYLILSLLIIISLFLAYTTFSVQGNYIILLIFSIIFTLLLSLYKIYLFKKFTLSKQR